MTSQAKKQKRKVRYRRPGDIDDDDGTENCLTCIKNIVILFNLLIWLFGAAVTGVGIWIKVDEDFWDIQSGLDMKQFSMAAYILIVAGVFIMLIGLIGCYGAYARSLCLLVTYAVVAIMIICMEVAAMGLVFTASRDKEVQEEIKVKARKALQEMARNDNQRYFLDLLQAKLKCCGVFGPEDYDLEDDGVPPSCTNLETSYPNKEGCLHSVMNYLKSKANIVGGVAFTVFVLQLIVLVLTLCLACGVRNAEAQGVIY